MASITPYTQGDWRRVRPRDIEIQAVRKLCTNPDMLLMDGPAFTIWEDSKPVMCGGVRIRGDGGGDGWLYCSNWIYNHFMVARLVKEFLVTIASDFNLDWIQTAVDTAFPETLRWLGWLDFYYDRDVPEFPGLHVYKRQTRGI